MNTGNDQAEMFGLIWRPFPHRFRLRVNDLIRLGDKLGLVVRINDCSAVVLMNRSPCEFTTRFDKPVRFQQKPVLYRISVNSEAEILNRTTDRKQKRKRRIA